MEEGQGFPYLVLPPTAFSPLKRENWEKEGTKWKGQANSLSLSFTPNPSYLKFHKPFAESQSIIAQFAQSIINGDKIPPPLPQQGENWAARTYTLWYITHQGRHHPSYRLRAQFYPIFQSHWKVPVGMVAVRLESWIGLGSKSPASLAAKGEDLEGDPYRLVHNFL